jgi:hypothetical protein
VTPSHPVECGFIQDFFEAIRDLTSERDGHAHGHGPAVTGPRFTLSGSLRRSVRATTHNDRSFGGLVKEIDHLNETIALMHPTRYPLTPTLTLFPLHAQNFPLLPEDEDE